jgi:hypothetical protein
MTKTFYIYLNTDESLSIQRISDESQTVPNTVEVKYDFEVVEGEEVEILNSNEVLQSDAGFILAVLRTLRNTLLNESDTLWIEATTRGLSAKVTEILEYKDNLRALPSTVDLSGCTRGDIMGLFPAVPMIN